MAGLGAPTASSATEGGNNNSGGRGRNSERGKGQGFGKKPANVRLRVLGGSEEGCPAGVGATLELQECDLARCAALWTTHVLGRLDRILPAVLAAVAAESGRNRE
jgi:hypothetical protein